MAELILIRHGKTAGNLLGRYIGSRTDEPLCDEGREGLAGKQLPEVERLYVSPMKRCVETAEILWPGFDRKKMQKVTDLRECDFGDFENKNYKELSGNGDYQAWIDSNGTLPFPNGESMDAFKSRCLEGLCPDCRRCVRGRAGMDRFREDRDIPGRNCGAWRHHYGNLGTIRLSKGCLF